jgi:hypothetical protein
MRSDSRIATAVLGADVGCTRLAIAAGLLLLSGAACNSETRSVDAGLPGSSPPSPMGGPGPQFRIPTFFDPSDWTTAIETAPLHLVVNNGGFPVDDGLLQDIGARLTLKTWPELTQVAATVAVTNASGLPEHDQFARLRVIPVTTLKDRWYALEVSGIPNRFAPPPRHLSSAGSDGAFRSRFRPGSEPRVSLVIFAEGKEKAEITFSERVTSDVASITDVIKVHGSSGSPLPCLNYEWKTGASTRSLTIVCAGASGASIKQVRVEDGLRSDSGTPMKPTVLQITEDQLLPCGDGCRAFHPQD